MKVTGKLFTLEEANQMLPLVKGIVSDIIASGKNLLHIEDHESVPLSKESIYKEMTQLFAELESLGCSYRDSGFSMGLVDFPSRLDGENILLCWRSDEAEISHYHSLDGGYAGRVKITEKNRERIGQ